MDELDELNEYLDEFMNEHNTANIIDFEGYSPDDMRYILYEPLGERSFVEIRRLDDKDYDDMAFFVKIRHLAKIIASEGEIRLTAKGFLPTKYIKELYEVGYIPDNHIDSKIYKLYKETDSRTVNLSRILLEISNIAKKRNGKLSLTKKGAKIIADNHEFLKLIIRTFCLKFNWAYYDGYDNQDIGQFGINFSLILLSKYGSEKRSSDFYADKLIRAFPALLDTVQGNKFSSPVDIIRGSYSIRLFNRFLIDYNLVEYAETYQPVLNTHIYVKKTRLFDELFAIKPPGSPLWN